MTLEEVLESIRLHWKAESEHITSYMCGCGEYLIASPDQDSEIEHDKICTGSSK